MSFEYKPIDSTGSGFRLLRLLKGDDDPIQCQLFESSLASPEDFGEYAALSYTWGSASRPCDIVIDGSKITVGKNAYLALRDLRYKDKDRILWIDALCIDQNNIRERGQQVQQMGSIYSKAERVLIWLDEATYATDYVMHHMKQLEKEGARYASSDQNISEKQWANIWSAMVHCLRADQRDLLVEGLQSLLRRNWFKRVWIIQETANARAAEVICGSKSVSASIFALMPSLLEVTPDPHCQPILDIMPGPLRNSSWWAKKRDLHTMLLKFCKSEATEPRDKIYALLGISSDACDTNLLIADYEKGLKDVILDTTLFLLNLNELDSPVRCFFNWELEDFLGNLNTLANELLKHAIETGNEALIMVLIVRDDIDVNMRASGKTSLSWAAENGHKVVVKLLLKTDKVEIDSKDKSSRTPLSWAAMNGHKEIVELLLETGKVEIDSKDEHGQTPLSSAAMYGRKEVVELLLETGKVEIDSKDEYGQTPLSWAVIRRCKEVVELLLKTGKVEIDSKENMFSMTPLMWTVRNRDEKVAKLLLETGKAGLNSTDKDGHTALSRATKDEDWEMVELLKSYKSHT